MGNEIFDSVVINAINNAKKSQDGSISRKNGIKILQEIFKKDSGLITMKAQKAIREAADPNNRYAGKPMNSYGFGFGFGGLLSQTKDLFELYMDKDSDGGEKITKGEQQEIIQTVKNWINDIKKLNQDINR